jgi:hypothetical protein
MTNPMLAFLGGGWLQAMLSIANAKSLLWPVLIVAIALDGSIVGIWYLLGVILNNDGVKSAARSETYQLVGTIILAMIIVGLMITYGSMSNVLLNSFGTQTVMSPAAISSICTALTSAAPAVNPSTGIVNPWTTTVSLIGPAPSLLAGGGSGSTFNGICYIDSNPSYDPVDYPLAATATIIANTLNQTAANLQTAYQFDAILGFLQVVKPSIGVCIDDTGEVSECDDPELATVYKKNVGDVEAAILNVTYLSQPYAGYDVLTANLQTLGMLMTAAVEMCAAQLNFIVMSLYIWPYLLFIGLVLRATMFTRPLGGLFIAAAITIVMIFPATYAIEYISLSNPSTTSNSLAATYLSNPTQNALLSTPQIQNLKLDFFVQPSMNTIITDTDKATPSVGSLTSACGTEDFGGSVLAAEGLDIGFMLVPFYNLAAVIGGGIIASISASTPQQVMNFPLPTYCQPAEAKAIFFQFLAVYGLMGINIYILPLFNIIISLSAMVGLSGLLGGDTNLAGLAKLIP